MPDRKRLDTGERKVFAGPRVRHLRMSLGLSQTAMARDLGISPSYLNLVERNQRPLTTQLLLKLSAIYELDLRELHGDKESERVAELTEIFADPVFGKMPSTAVIGDLVNGYPDVTGAFASLYSAYRKAQMQPKAADATGDSPPGLDDPRYPIDEVRDYFSGRDNYIPSLDLAAEAFHASLAAADNMFGALQAHLRDTHQIRLTVLPIHAMPDTQRRYDRHNRRVFLSELLSQPDRTFQTAAQIALLTYAEEIDRLIGEAMLSSAEANQLLRIALANYFAGALMMPYGRFIEAATSTRYDLDVLAGRFGANFRQVTHRLATLQKSERRGVPFFLVCLDHAGNVLKRVSAGGFPFARFGGICPRWDVYQCFTKPGETIIQHIELPDGARYLTVSRAVETIHGPHPSEPRRIAMSLGCDVNFAKSIVYGDGFNLASAEGVTPTGLTCRVCERVNCPARAIPAVTRPLRLDPSRKSLWPFEFL